MALLIAVTGLSGAGKTTAISWLANSGVGEKVYLGQSVLDEVRARGLPPGPQSERQVRLDLRNEFGAGILARRAVSKVKDYLDSGTNVLVDAIFEHEEYRCFENCCSGSSLILL